MFFSVLGPIAFSAINDYIASMAGGSTVIFFRAITNEGDGYGYNQYD